MDRTPSAVSPSGLKELAAEERALLNRMSKSKPQQEAPVLILVCVLSFSPWHCVPVTVQYTANGSHGRFRRTASTLSVRSIAKISKNYLQLIQLLLSLKARHHPSPDRLASVKLTAGINVRLCAPAMFVYICSLFAYQRSPASSLKVVRCAKVTVEVKEELSKNFDAIFFLHEQLSIVLQALGQEDRAQQPRISTTSSISSALQQHALAAQRRGPSHMPPASADLPSKRSKHAPSKQDAPHSSTPQKPAVSSPGPSAVHLTPEHPATSAHRQGGARTAAHPPSTLAIPGVVAPGPMPPKGPVPLPSNLGNSAWPVLPYLENVEHAIAHADSQPLTFHRSVSRPLSDFLTAVMHSLGVQVHVLLNSCWAYLRVDHSFLYNETLNRRLL